MKPLHITAVAALTFASLHLLSGLPGCGGSDKNDTSSSSDSVDGSDSGNSTDTAAPTLESCKAWILENHRSDYPANGCWTLGPNTVEEWADYFDSFRNLEGGFGGTLPVGDGRFVNLWIPDTWETQEQGQTLVVGLHGSSGCTSSFFDEWYDYTARDHKYALAAVQWMGATYSKERDDYYIDTETDWDSGEVIFAMIQEFLDELFANCPFDNAGKVLYGFSRGAARSFHVTACDSYNLSRNGFRYFDATVADSGGGEFYEDDDWCWADLDAVDYLSSRFWLFCGTADSGGENCDHMSSSQDSVEDRNGIIDELYMEEGRGHGIFSDDGSPHSPESPSKAQTAMFDYIESFSSR